MSKHRYEIGAIQKILDVMNAIEPLPAIGSPEYQADPNTWKQRREQIARCERDIEITALLSVPPEIDTLVRQMRARRDALLDEVIRKIMQQTEEK